MLCYTLVYEHLTCTLHLLSLISSVILLLLVILVFRRRRDTDNELSLSRAPLLRKDRAPCHVYGVPCDADPVYAGWWHSDNAESKNKHRIISSYCKVPCCAFGRLLKMFWMFAKNLQHFDVHSSFFGCQEFASETAHRQISLAFVVLFTAVHWLNEWEGVSL